MQLGIPIFFLVLLISSSTCSLFYELKTGIPRCYLEELFSPSVLMMKWKVFTKKRSNVSLLLPQISISITAESTSSRKEVFRHVLTSEKSKTTYNADKEGVLRICVLFKGKNQPSDDSLFLNLKFGSDNMDDPDINKALKEKDITDMQRKINSVLELGKPIIESQKQEIILENKNAEETLKSTKWYKLMALVQIVLCISIGLFQLNNFRKFLKSQNVI